MALELNGTTGVSLVQDGVVTAADLAAGAVGATQLASTLDLTGKTVTLPSGTGGKVLKYQHDKNGTTYETTSSTLQTGPSATFTPTVSGSKVLCRILAPMRGCGSGVAENRLKVRITFNGSYTDSDYQEFLNYDYGGSGDCSSSIFVWERETTSTGSAITVTMEYARLGSGNSASINYTASSSDIATTITWMEIAA